MMFSVIKAIKANMPDMNLVASKKFIESLPQVVRKDVPKERVFRIAQSLFYLSISIEKSETFYSNFSLKQNSR